MKKTSLIASAPDINRLIHTLRNEKVILDTDLAALYAVPTKRLNEQVKRNADRFPADFMFQLTAQELRDLKSKIATSGLEVSQIEGVATNWSQIATSSKRHRGAAYRPFAFTEHGALMAANILNSPRAISMSVYLIRAFVKMREDLIANAAILKRLAEIDKSLLTHDLALRDIYQKLRPLLAPPPDPPKPEIGFHIKEDAAPYRTVRKRTVRCCLNTSAVYYEDQSVWLGEFDRTIICKRSTLYSQNAGRKSNPEQSL